VFKKQGETRKMIDKEYELCKKGCEKEGCHCPEDYKFHSAVANTPMFIRVYFYLKGKQGEGGKTMKINISKILKKHGKWNEYKTFFKIPSGDYILLIKELGEAYEQNNETEVKE